MPISRPQAIPVVMDEVILINPKSIIDVGIGFGIYGVLFRAYTDIRAAENDPARYKKFQTKITGIDIWSDYDNPIWNYVYDRIIIGDALDEIKKIESEVDLIFLGDVIEHLAQERGEELLKVCREKARTVIVTTPNTFRPQGCAVGNPHEKHISFWDNLEGAKKVSLQYQNVFIFK